MHVASVRLQLGTQSKLSVGTHESFSGVWLQLAGWSKVLHILPLGFDSCRLPDHRPAWELLYWGSLCLFCHKPKYSYQLASESGVAEAQLERTYVHSQQLLKSLVGIRLLWLPLLQYLPWARIFFFFHKKKRKKRNLNKNLTCPVDAQVFKDLADKKFESLLKASFYCAACGGGTWHLSTPKGPF